MFTNTQDGKGNFLRSTAGFQLIRLVLVLEAMLCCQQLGNAYFHVK